MKIIKLFIALTIICLLTACNFNKSVSADLMTGMKTTGDGLSAEDVYISLSGEKVTDNVFVYGQEIYTNFKSIDGFVLENGKIYPEMSVVVVSKKGDTVLQNKNLLNGKAIKGSIADLNANIILAAPIHSGEEYEVIYAVSDTKGDGIFQSEFKLALEKDPGVNISEKGLSIKEAYIYNQDTRKIILDGELNFESNVVLDLQGLDGYVSVDGKQSLGMSVVVQDANGTIILDLPDLLKNSDISEAQIKKGLGSTLKLNRGTIANPINWKVRVWDKNGDGELTAVATLKVE